MPHTHSVGRRQNAGTAIIPRNVSTLHYILNVFEHDTRILLGIKDEEDTQMLQNALHTYTSSTNGQIQKI